MNYRSIGKFSRFGTDNAGAIASGDLVTGSVPSAQLAAAPSLTSAGALSLATGITPRESGYHPIHQTVLQFTAQPITITDALQYIGLQVYSFPAAHWLFLLKCSAKFTFTTTSAISTTLNSGVTGAWSMGSVTASSTTLNSTMADFIASTAWTSGTVINTANTATTGTLTTSVHFGDGAATKALFLNLAIAGATDIDADATVAVDGVVVLTWIDEGTYGLTWTP